MYKKVLVPLDGSELAECALSHVRNLSKDGCVGEIILLNVVEMEVPLSYVNSEYDGVVQGFDFPAFWDDLLDKAQKYLESVQSRLSREGIKAETVIIKGSRPAQAIVDYADKNHMDLIVIATHGYTGIKKLTFGSVALSVLHDSFVSVLLVRQESCSK